MPTTLECDLLVLGSGAGGLATALAGSVLGLDVVLSEHTPLLGGASAISGGELWIPANRQSGGTQADSPQHAVEYLSHVIGPTMDVERVEAYATHAAEALAFFEDHSHVRYERLNYVVDYFSDHPGATAGLRSLGAIPFDGRLLGYRFPAIRPPLPNSTILGGMSLGREDIPHFGRFHRSPRSFAHVAGMTVRHARDRLAGHARGTRMVMGNALVGRLVLSLHERSVRMLTNTATRELLLDDGAVVGALLEGPDGALHVRTRRGVAVATGSFSGSRARQAEFYPHVRAGQEHRTPVPPTNDGSGMDLVLRCGGVLDRSIQHPGAFTPFSVVHAAGQERVMPHFGDRARPGVIIVNDRGRRFANEALNYHDFVREMLATNSGRSSAECYVVTSHRHLRKYGLGRVPAFPGRASPFVRSGYLVRDETMRGLASKLRIDALALEQTVRTFDRDAEGGIDAEFRKGGTAFERAAGDASVSPNPCVAPLGAGPYYAVRIVPGDIGTFLGVKVDRHSRAINAAGDPIGGLYAVGTVAASVMGGTYPAAGAMLGPALTFGYLAALHARSQRRTT